MDAASSTASRLQWTLISLLIIYTVSFLLSPFAWLPLFCYLVLVVIGIIGTRRRHSGLLKIYWVVQFISLFLMVIGFIFILVMYYQHRTEIQIYKNELTVNQQLALEGIAFAFFVIDLVLKVRSIVLAQRLSKQLQILPYVEESELNNISEESEVQDPNAQPIYVIPQPMFAAHQINTAVYPGVNNLIPIYVDSYGNPILQTNFQM